MNPTPAARRNTLLAGAAGVAAVIAYSPGLQGPFVLDDHVNLAPVWAWLQGTIDAHTAALANPSGPTGRPLAYLSFMANAAAGATSPFGFKLVNLLLHLACAFLVALTCLEFQKARKAPGSGQAPAGQWPLVLAAVWTVHPMHVSTVLYVVQRMALLGAIAQLAAVLVYLRARAESGRDPRRSALLLFIAVPAIVAAGLAAKETAALALLLCLAIEIALPKPPPEARWQRSRSIFFAVFIGVPALLAAAILLARPEWITASYAAREFEIGQRLLTQPRVLFDYALATALPLPSLLGLYRDGYPHASGLLQPPSTLFFLALWLGLAAAAVLLRRRLALFSLGVLWFLAGHALEAGPIALEPYFEHRNYLPSLGLLLALAACLARPWRALPPIAATAVAVSGLFFLTALTAQRTWHWGDHDRLLASEGPPAGELSRRLQVDRAIRGFELGQSGTREQALAELAGGNPGDVAAANLWRAIFACDTGTRVSPETRQGLLSNVPRVVTHNLVSYLEVLARRVHADRCDGLDESDLGAIAGGWIRDAGKPITETNRERVERLAGKGAGP